MNPTRVERTAIRTGDHDLVQSELVTDLDAVNAALHELASPDSHVAGSRSLTCRRSARPDT